MDNLDADVFHFLHIMERLRVFQYFALNNMDRTSGRLVRMGFRIWGLVKRINLFTMFVGFGVIPN